MFKYCPDCGEEQGMDACPKCGCCPECGCEHMPEDDGPFDADEMGEEPEDEYERRTR